MSGKKLYEARSPWKREKRTIIGLAKFIASASHLPYSKEHYEDFGEARIEAFGINIFALYENHVGGMENGHWSPYNRPAGEQYPGLSVSDILTKAF
ncbi:hypothetical protein HO173_012624 [Letharia columbiana]|uniref:Uncharacterized protein n=1 Tax=Letharia columbiana TaxID=112416 RepID=A0A8H6FFJ1_9LECA|nr:uncharacterized protein HO173_012624 [Letharia columbiana]KAF6225994.1 hypothetical protein HO173_012624 [Letharia columbiana]